VPEYNVFKFKQLVLDYNETLACDRQLISGVKVKLKALKINAPSTSLIAIAKICNSILSKFFRKKMTSRMFSG